MQPYSIAGVLLIIVGVLALTIRSVTYFSTETVSGPLGYFAWDVSKPHTIFVNPVAGLVAIAAGILLIALAPKANAA